MAVSNRKKTPRSRLLSRIGIAVVVLLGLLAGYLLLFPNVGKPRQPYLYIPTGATYQQVLDSLEAGNFVRDRTSFDFVANRVGYPEQVQAGRYEIKQAMSLVEIVRMLRAGSQSPVKLVVPKMRTEADFVKLLAGQLEPSVEDMETLLQDTVYLDSLGLKRETLFAAVFPDTYEFYWNTTPKKAFGKFYKASQAFWTDARKAAAKAQGLSVAEVATLASIVEEETQNVPEKPTIASVYLNRYRKGMKLQADPTARFAGGDFTIKRVTSKQTGIASPYNTYYVKGLPPGPICTPSKSSLEAVLKAPKTDYLFFCAKEDFSGSHNFAATYAEHMVNARKFQKAMNERGIH